MGAAVPKLRSPPVMEAPPACPNHTCPPRDTHHTCHSCHATFTCHACPYSCGDRCGCQGGSAPTEDAFMSAVLAFCSHMSGRLDALDNCSIYDEFRTYTAASSTKVA